MSPLHSSELFQLYMTNFHQPKQGDNFLAYVAGMLLELLIGLKEELQEPGLRARNWDSVPPRFILCLSPS